MAKKCIILIKTSDKHESKSLIQPEALTTNKSRLLLTEVHRHSNTFPQFILGYLPPNRTRTWGNAMFADGKLRPRCLPCTVGHLAIKLLVLWMICNEETSKRTPCLSINANSRSSVCPRARGHLIRCAGKRVMGLKTRDVNCGTSNNVWG